MLRLNISLIKNDKQSFDLKLFIVFILIFTAFKGFSQTQKTYFIPDSLKSNTYEELYRQYSKYYVKEDTLNQYFYAKMYLHKAKNEKDTIRIANGYSQFTPWATPELLDKYADSIISHTKNSNNKIYPGYGYLIKGMANFHLANYTAAIDNYLLAQVYATKNKNNKQLSEINNGIGEIKMIWGNYTEAIQSFKSQLKLVKESDTSQFNQEKYLVILSNITNCYIQLRHPDSAMYYNDLGYKKSLTNKDDYWKLSFIKKSGYILYYKNEFKKALDSINKGLPSDESANNFLNTAHYKAQIYSKLNDSINAHFYFKKADSIFDANPHEIIPEVKEVQEYFVKYYTKNGDINNQLKYINRLLSADEIVDSYKKELNETILKKYDRPKLLAEKQSIIDKLERKKTKSRLFIVILFAILSLFVGLSIRFFYLQNIYKKRFKSLVNNPKKEPLAIISRDPLQDISPDVIDLILNQLEQFEKNHHFLDKNITLARLAKTYNTNSSYLSKIVNHFKKQNFNSYVSNLRIDYCLNKLKKDKVLRSYTVKAIANEMGFKNSESFSRAFYKKTGIYPSFYIKQIEKQIKKSVI